MKTLLTVLALAAASPALAQQPAAAAPPAAQTQSAAQPTAEGIKGLRNGMAVVSSDGATVAEVAHTYGRTDYGPNQTFFIEDRYMNLRRIYGREAFVDGDKVRLRMTAAQFRARMQNPPE